MIHHVIFLAGQRLLRGLAILLAAGLFVAQTQGASIDLVTDAPLTMLPGTVSGSAMALDVTNNDPTPPVEDNLTGWQVRLWIVPDPGATGTVGFDSAALPGNYHPQRD